LIGWNLVSLGTMNETIAHPREIFRPAVMAGAAYIALLHNHPSGDPSPSEADRRLTVRVREVGSLLQIEVLDHIVIGGTNAAGEDRYFSFKEAGML
jgi:DNA repair protein RadC